MMKKIVIWELALIIATVPVFRAVWIILDSIDFFNKIHGIIFSFAGGIAIALWALVMIHRK